MDSITHEGPGLIVESEFAGSNEDRLLSLHQRKSL
jgi:hypothetical protein